jgi:hypothetical protein
MNKKIEKRQFYVDGSLLLNLLLIDGLQPLRNLLGTKYLISLHRPNNRILKHVQIFLNPLMIIQLIDNFLQKLLIPNLHKIVSPIVGLVFGVALLLDVGEAGFLVDEVQGLVLQLFCGGEGVVGG